MRTLVVIAVLASAASLFAQDEKRIQDAIKGLGADSFEEREKATADLKKIGAPALDALKKAAEENGDPEVRVRAKRLVDEIARPAAPPKQSRAPGAGPTMLGSRVSIRQTKDGTIYSLTPTDGDAIEFHRLEGKVKLVYPGDKDSKAEVEAESIEKFVADHKELAAKYGITKDGIDYGGTKLSFNGIREIPGFPQLGAPVPMPPQFDNSLDELRKANEELQELFKQWRGLDRWPRDEWWASRDFFGRQVIRGAQLAPVPDVLRSQLSIPEGQGVVVETVREGSTGAAAGLKKHDVILEIDGQTVTGPADVLKLLKRDSKVKALRGGKEQTLQPAPPAKKEY
ncbi:MAG TPA: PDZ domain-containing protein [Planctomycetota bacterium]|nr:PDZ domain-containing protein [Planctomycetota bacterium]